ncbi:MAG: CarD family transcriptional regulator [Christensenellales bacterium]
MQINVIWLLNTDEKKLMFLQETFKANNINYHLIDTVEQMHQSGIFLAVIENAYGFEDLNGQFEIITPNEFAPGKIIKSSKYQKFLKESVKIYNKEELNPGDYVVHQDYGIGKYLGIRTRELRNTLNDYLCVEYADASTLYIPVENIYVLEKYIGSKDKLPKLNSLNSKEWQKKKERIKEKTKDIAKKLIKVQAERESRVGFVYKSDSLEQIEFENDFMYKETPDQKKSN